jgi:hypothetical protein
VARFFLAISMTSCELSCDVGAISAHCAWRSTRRPVFYIYRTRIGSILTEIVAVRRHRTRR